MKNKQDQRYFILINDKEKSIISGHLNELYTELEEEYKNESVLIQNNDSNDKKGRILIKDDTDKLTHSQLKQMILNFLFVIVHHNPPYADLSISFN